MRNSLVRSIAKSVIARSPLVAALLCAANIAISDEWAPAADGWTGPYSIGHTTLVITDSSRNPDGSTPVASAGRPLYLHIWYPAKLRNSEHISYGWNNPIYNRNSGGTAYPGLPNLPALGFKGSSSLNPVAEDAALADGKFPLLVATHGDEVAAAKNMSDTLETLASQGYVVASVEHTGNNDAWYQAYFLETYLGLSLGPNPIIDSPSVIYQRAKDVSFVISATLQGILNQKTGLAFLNHIDSEEIGVLGYSLGGQTSLATVAGIGTEQLPADPRVKAAFMGAGSNYGLLLDSSDYAHVKVPLLFYGNDTGIAYENFNAFTHSSPKYLVDIGGINHHTGGYQSSWCQDFHNSMIAVNPGVYPQVFVNPAALSSTDIVDYVFDATFYFSYSGARESGVYDYCDASALDGISDAQLQAVLFGAPEILTVKNELQPLMPLKPQVSIAETTRLANWYAVSFFNKILKHEDVYDRYLTDSEENRRANPLVEFVADCEQITPHPIDLKPGDQITFLPSGNTGYTVSVSPGAALLDRGTTQLNVGGDGSATLSYPGFSFPVPGMSSRIDTLIVDEDGAITTRTSPDYATVDDNGSPWYMRGQLLLSNEFTIGALMKDLDSTAAAAGGGVFGYYDSAHQRVIVTYAGVPAAGTTQPNTLQIAIYADGKIQMTLGALASTGPSYTPTILGTIGISSGQTKASELSTTKPIRFSELRGNAPVFIPVRGGVAIYEQFYLGNGASCNRGGGAEQSD
jgi:dienelactone hydrolase